LQGNEVHSKKLPAASSLQVVPSAVLSDQLVADSFKSAHVHLSSNHTLVANIKSSGQFKSVNVAKHQASPSIHSLSVQPTLPLSKVSEQITSHGAADSFVSASPSSQPSSQADSFSQPMWMKTGLIALVEVPLHQHA
jgi:hypothetical protein